MQVRDIFHRLRRGATSDSVIYAVPRTVDRIEDCYFYHTMELPEFGLLKGHWDLRGKFDDYVGHVDLSGKSVLDVGTATGFLTFEAERRGASRVVSFDMSDVRQQTFVPFPNGRASRDGEGSLGEYSVWMDRWKNAYWLCHRLLKSGADVFYGDLLELPPALGKFDVAIVGSVLEHLRDPAKALESIAGVTGGTMVVVTPLVESDEPIARFEPRAANPEQDFTWWTYSAGLYRELLAILGFRVDSVTTAEYWHDYAQQFEPRATIVATRI